MKSSRKLGDYDISQPRPISVHRPQQSMIMQQIAPLFSDHATINSINFQCYCGLWNRWSRIGNWGTTILVRCRPPTPQRPHIKFQLSSSRNILIWSIYYHPSLYDRLTINRYTIDIWLIATIDIQSIAIRLIYNRLIVLQSIYERSRRDCIMIDKPSIGIRSIYEQLT